MTAVLGAENFHGGFGLCQGRHEVGFGGLAVGVEVPGAKRLALAHAGVDDNAVDASQFRAESIEHGKHLIVVVHVQRLDQHLDAGMLFFQLGLQCLQPIHAPGTQRQVASHGGKQARHAFAQTGAGAGD